MSQSGTRGRRPPRPLSQRAFAHTPRQRPPTTACFSLWPWGGRVCVSSELVNSHNWADSAGWCGQRRVCAGGGGWRGSRSGRVRGPHRARMCAAQGFPPPRGECVSRRAQRPSHPSRRAAPALAALHRRGADRAVHGGPGCWCQDPSPAKIWAVVYFVIMTNRTCDRSSVRLEFPALGNTACASTRGMPCPAAAAGPAAVPAAA